MPKDITTNDVKLHIEDHGGDGRPVVLIHGWPMSGKAWEKQVPDLKSAGFRVITYDRRGFGESEKPDSGYDYDTLADDLHGIVTELELEDASLVGFSMGGGEVARYIARHGDDHLHSVVFAAAVPPYMMKTEDNPDGPLTPDAAQELEAGLKKDRDAFFDDFTKNFFSADGELKVSEEDRQKAIKLCKQSDQTAALGCMEAFGTTDFRADLAKVQTKCLVIHGDSDAIVPIEGSGERTKTVVVHAELEVLEGAPHGCNVSHPEAFNEVLLKFLHR
ncbi:alpha/beta fold hydrolase [Maritimibacter dapengensis]|uniref:Alpha/beta hydrolase n=1 Tax=Maritimibacter dapengensis TaxID=2836868 RepID=A0ABS6SYV2_9RHOB|nr:alpha/beta hydrolase [Maritimibacter dapengensis]MBV7377536.1 alpha/beta hydrolase [Maritimibacter dapengensis]